MALFSKNKQVKIYAERNSGSLYLEWLLNKNLKVDRNEGFELGWKRRIAPGADELSEEMRKNMNFICMVKNPYSWLLSLHRRPVKHESLRETSFSDFIRYSFGDYPNPVVIWNKKIRSYVEMESYVEKYLLIFYEKLLETPKAALEAISLNFDIPKSFLWFKNLDKQISNNYGVMSKRFPKGYYLKERWKEELDYHDIQFINEHLDLDLAKSLNYEIL